MAANPRECRSLSPLHRAAACAGLLLEYVNGIIVLTTGEGVVVHRALTKVGAICWMADSRRRTAA